MKRFGEKIEYAKSEFQNTLNSEDYSKINWETVQVADAYLRKRNEDGIEYYKSIHIKLMWDNNAGNSKKEVSIGDVLVIPNSGKLKILEFNGLY